MSIWLLSPINGACSGCGADPCDSQEEEYSGSGVVEEVPEDMEFDL